MKVRWVLVAGVVGLSVAIIASIWSVVQYHFEEERNQLEAIARESYEAHYRELVGGPEHLRLVEQTRQALQDNSSCAKLRTQNPPSGTADAKWKALCEKYGLGLPPSESEVKNLAEPRLVEMALSVAGLTHMPMTSNEIDNARTEAQANLNNRLRRIGLAAAIGCGLLFGMNLVVVSIRKGRVIRLNQLRHWVGGVGGTILLFAFGYYLAVWSRYAKTAERYQLVMAGRIKAGGSIDALVDAKVAIDRAGLVAGFLGVVALSLLALALYRRVWQGPKSVDHGQERETST
jgi:hypothetical protein